MVLLGSLDYCQRFLCFRVGNILITRCRKKSRGPTLSIRGLRLDSVLGIPYGQIILGLFDCDFFHGATLAYDVEAGGQTFDIVGHLDTVEVVDLGRTVDRRDSHIVD